MIFRGGPVKKITLYNFWWLSKPFLLSAVVLAGYQKVFGIHDFLPGKVVALQDVVRVHMLPKPSRLSCSTDLIIFTSQCGFHLVPLHWPGEACCTSAASMPSQASQLRLDETGLSTSHFFWNLCTSHIITYILENNQSVYQRLRQLHWFFLASFLNKIFLFFSFL